MSSSSRVVVIGGGIHGVSTAFYLAKLGVRSLIIEQTGIASAASGKAGGFLARDWGDGPTVPLHQKSFELHQKLAEELDVKSYRRVKTLEVNGNRKAANVAPWLDKKASSELMDQNTAQVTPRELTEKMVAWAQACQIDGEPAVQVLIDTVLGIQREVISDETATSGVGESIGARPTLGPIPVPKQPQRVSGVITKHNGFIPSENAIICLGPWSGVAVEDWLELPLPMNGLKSTSMIFSGVPQIVEDPYACFCAEDGHGCHLELYPRQNGDLYVCGCGGSDLVNGDRLRKGGDCASSDKVVADTRRVAVACKALRNMTSIISDDQKPDILQACMRPCTPDGLPVMGSIPGIPGAYISCGHDCWGILWAPVCGLAMAELVLYGEARSVNIDSFYPDRYMLAVTGRSREISSDRTAMA